MEPVKTPWQKVHAKFGLSSNALARAIGKDRGNMSRKLRDEKGLINGDDQRAILEAAKRLNVDLKPEDMLPVV